MLRDFVDKGGVIFTHSGRYTNTNNSCYVFAEDEIEEGFQIDMYTPKSAGIKNEDGENLWQLLTTDSTFFKVYSGVMGGELQTLLKSVCKTEMCVKTLPQVYFKNEKDYDLLVPVGSAHNLKHGTDFMWKNKYYKTFTHKLGGSNPQNCTHACNKMRGGFKAFNTTPMTVSEEW